MKGLKKFSLIFLLIIGLIPIVPNQAQGITSTSDEMNQPVATLPQLEASNVDNYNISVQTITPITTRDTQGVVFNSHSEKKNNAGTSVLTLSDNTPQTLSDEGNLEVKDGKIISANPGYFSTIGGVNNLVNVYETLENAQNNYDPIPISGASYDGIYYETQHTEMGDFAHVLIGGVEGYVDVNQIQIIPTQLALASTYYTNENGHLMLYEAVDPAVSSDYSVYDLGPTSMDMNHEKYVKTNASTYTSIETNKQTREFDYFQYLPFRATTNYNADDFNRYLAYVGHTDSQYYNNTQAFFTGGEYKGVNPLLLFAMANHESAYGTSYYARTCNNFYGRAAYDSNPDEACNAVTFTSPFDGAAAQAFFLNDEFGDPLDYRYYGTHLGDKSGGLNRYYASDPAWGSKIAHHMYLADQYLGGRDNNYFSIAFAHGPNAYFDANLTQVIPVVGAGQREDLKLISDIGSAIPTIVTGESGSSYKVQLDVAINRGSPQLLHFINSTGGSFPNYKGNTSTCAEVGTNEASYLVSYNNNYMQNQGYVNKNSISFINHANFVSPGDFDPLAGGIDNGGIKYNTIQNDSWLYPVGDSMCLGDPNSNSPLSSFVLNTTFDANSIEYRGHFSRLGWSDIAQQGEVLGDGTKPLEAIQIDLTGDNYQNYDIYYRVYTKRWGWLDWAKNGGIAGSYGLGENIYAIEVKLVDKNSTQDLATQHSYYGNSFLYQTHQSGIGWSDMLTNNKPSANANNKSKIEAVRVFMPTDYVGNINVTTHVEGIGDMSVGNGQIAGTVGQGRRVEALKFDLSGDIANYYQLNANTYIQDLGWSGTSQLGSYCGSRGISKELYSLVLDFSDKSNIASKPYSNDNATLLMATAKVDDNWQQPVKNSGYIGTVGKGSEINALQIDVNNDFIDNISYDAHISNYGWDNGNQNGEIAHDQKYNKIEAVRLTLDSNYYDIYYQAHVQNVGWQDWKKNGEVAGTTGQNLRLEALRICVVLKPEYQHPTINYERKN